MGLPFPGLGNLGALSSGLLPWACEGIPLDGDVLEIGPGCGVTTRWAAPARRAGHRRGDRPRPGRWPCRTLGDRVDASTADGAALPWSDAAFDAVLCFTMLHHVPSPQQQDRLFAEAAQVPRPGGTFAGADGTSSALFRLLHAGDTMVAVDPAALPDRLRAPAWSTRTPTSAPARCASRATR